MLQKVASEEKRKTAANTSDKNVLERKFFLFRSRKLFVFGNKAERNKRNENDTADKCADTVKSECADACTFTLGNE